MLRRACLAAYQPRYLAAYAAARALTDPTADERAWRADARAAGVDLTALVECATGGQGRALSSASRALADSLQLDPGTVSTLADNRTLLRRAPAGRIVWPDPEGE